MNFVLASSSPRRSHILEMLGYSFKIIPSDFDESSIHQNHPEKLVLALAKAKSIDISLKHPDNLVLGYDSVVFLKEQILGKPNSQEEARKYLNYLSGCTHEVFTGVAITQSGNLLAEGAACTQVKFKKLSVSEIDNYILTGSPMDKAGAYGIQDQGAKFVESINGCFYNVMGCPVVLTETLLLNAMEIINGRS